VQVDLKKLMTTKIVKIAPKIKVTPTKDSVSERWSDAGQLSQSFKEQKRSTSNSDLPNSF